ncbi:hypothetical protein [uncultured Clostridium sp.]|uniref:hypothetical protein n=1 Tax=uncultured Clostridium sp. TaxID=59620 RepID=UPI0026334029|nr:hypothetical protein [uncultured Clostridium sp.]
MEFDDIKTILVVVEFNDGNTHQVLSTKEHKKLSLQFLSGLDDGLTMSKEIETFTLDVKQK